MGTLLLIMVLASALAALVAGIIALSAWLRFHLVRTTLMSHLSSEVARLASRTAELEESLSALDARAQALPVYASELQENLATIRILTNVLATSIRQAQRVLVIRGLRPFIVGALKVTRNR